MITSFQKKDKFKNPILFPQKRGSRKKRIKKKNGRKDKHERKKKKRRRRKDKHKTKGQKIKIE